MVHKHLKIEALKTAPNTEFNNVLIVCKSLLDQTQTKLEVGELLIKAREEYRWIYALKTWNGSANEIPRKLQADRDITALLANVDAQKEQT